MECQDMLELLSASLDGELTETEQTQLNAHLDTCPSCRALYEELAGLHAACDLETEVPAELTDRILGALPSQRSGKVVYWKRWGAMAAAMVLVALAAWRLPQHLPAGEGNDSAKPETSEETVMLTTAMMDETVPTETDIAWDRAADAPAYGASSHSAPVDQAPTVDTGTGSIHSAPAAAKQEVVSGVQDPAAAEQAPVNGAQDPAAPGQLPVGGEQSSTNTQQAAGKRAMITPFSAPIPDPGTDIAPGAVLFTSGVVPAGGADETNAPESFDAPGDGEVPEDVPEMTDAEVSITAVPFEELAEDVRDFSSYRCVLTLSQAEFAQDYPKQFQPSGEMWYLVPLEVLESLPQTLAEEDPLYVLRDQGEDLDTDSPYALVVVPPAF